MNRIKAMLAIIIVNFIPLNAVANTTEGDKKHMEEHLNKGESSYQFESFKEPVWIYHDYKYKVRIRFKGSYKCYARSYIESFHYLATEPTLKATNEEIDCGSKK